MTEYRPGNGDPLLLSARYLHAPLANSRIDPLRGTTQQIITRGLVQCIPYLLIGRIRLNEPEILPIVPANNWASCDTNPICRRNGLYLICEDG